MRNEDAKRALRLITKVLNDPRLEPDDSDRLRKAKQGLRAMARSGKIQRRKLFRLVQVICLVLQNRM